MKRFTTTVAAAGFMLAGFATTASAQILKYQAVPALFIGTAAECNPFPAGSKIVTAAWLVGMGLPDNGTAHPGGKNPHHGLLLSKHGPTGDCSAATADIVGWDSAAPVNTLGFDIRKGSACGGGAVRINVYTTAGTYFFGCAHGNKTAAPQDPANWDRITFSQAGEPVGGYPGATGFTWGVGGGYVTGIEIVHDEGTDTVTPDNPAGIGLVVIDNIRINNTVITQKKGNPITP